MKLEMNENCMYACLAFAGALAIWAFMFAASTAKPTLRIPNDMPPEVAIEIAKAWGEAAKR